MHLKFFGLKDLMTVMKLKVGATFTHLFQCNFDLKANKFEIPLAFYKEVLYTWEKINCSSPDTKEQVLKSFGTIASLKSEDFLSITKNGTKPE